MAAIYGQSFANVGNLTTSYPGAGVACVADAAYSCSKAWPPYAVTAVVIYGIVASSASQIEFYLTHQDDGEYPICGPLVMDISTVNSQTEGVARYSFARPLRVNFINSTINASGNAEAMVSKHDATKEYKIYLWAKTNTGTYGTTVGLIEWEGLREG